MKSVFHHQGGCRAVSSDDWVGILQSEGLRAVVFDCDGTLVESTDAHWRCMQAAARDQGCEMAPDWYRARTGLDRKSLFEAFGESRCPAFDVDRACTVSIQRYSTFVRLVRPVEEVVAFASTLRALHIPMAVATNAEREVAEQSLRAIGAGHMFDVLVSISDGVRPKPSPELFQSAARQLGYAPHETLVIEDSAQGVSAATTAGAHVIELVQHVEDDVQEVGIVQDPVSDADS